MNEEELLELYGLDPDEVNWEAIRQLLHQEIENQNLEDNEVLKLLCIMLFCIGNVEDTQLIWRAKRKNQDTGSYIDVQLLCGAGYERTLFYLENMDGGRHMRSCFTLNSASRMILLIFPKWNGSQTMNNITVFDICAHWKESYYAKFA